MTYLRNTKNKGGRWHKRKPLSAARPVALSGVSVREALCGSLVANPTEVATLPDGAKLCKRCWETA